MRWFNKIIIFLFIFFVSCTSRNGTENIISVSIPPLKYMVEKISGDRFKINILLPPGASPETYEISPKQVKDLAESRFLFITGLLSYEHVLKYKMPGINKKLVIGDISKGIKLINEGHRHDRHTFHGADPHIWLSPKTVKIIASNILNTLINNDPDFELYYRNGYQHLMEEIERADMVLRILFSGVKRKSFLIFHPALGYLARDYGLEQIALEFEGKTPPPAYIQKIVDIAGEKNIKAILIQKEFNIDNAKSMANEIGGEIIQIDPLAENWYEEIIKTGNLLHKLFSDAKTY